MAESDSRVARNLSTFSGAKHRVHEQVGAIWVGVSTGSKRLRTPDFEVNTEMRHLEFSRAELAVVPFDVREGMEGKHTPETDLTRHHQV